MRTILFLFFALAFFSSCEKAADSTSAAATTATGKGGSLARFTIVGNYLYLADVTTLKVFDITNPQSATQKGSINMNFGVETIFPYKDKLFIGSIDGMYIYSITNPAQPVLP